MASYYLSVNSVQCLATAAAAYRHAERIACERIGRVHDYRAKAGVEASFILSSRAMRTTNTCTGIRITGGRMASKKKKSKLSLVRLAAPR